MSSNNPSKPLAGISDMSRPSNVKVERPPPPPPAPDVQPLFASTSSGGARVAVFAPLFAIGALALVGIVVALAPQPTVISGNYELSARGVENVEVKSGGLVGTVDVKEGDWVESGAVLFSFDAEGAKKQLASLEKKIANLEKSPALKKSAEAKKKLETAQAELEGEQAAMEVLEAKGKKAAMKLQEKKVEKAQTAVNQAQKAYDAARSGGAAAENLEKMIAERDALKDMTDMPPVKAPAEGFVRELKVKSGEMLKAPATIAVMEDSKVLNAKLTAPAGEPKWVAGEEATLSINGKKVQAKIIKVNGSEAFATVENPKGNYKASTKGTLQAPGAKRSLLGQYF